MKRLLLFLCLSLTLGFSQTLSSGDKALFDASVQAFKQGNYQSAKPNLEKLLALYPENEAVIFYLGRIEYEQKNYELAYIYFDRILITNPKNTRARLELARSLYELGTYDEALSELNKALISPMPETVRANVEKYIALVKETQKGYKISGAFVFGLGWDNNINNNTHIPNTPYGNVLLDNDTNEVSDFYHREILALNHLYSFDKQRAWNTMLVFYNQMYNKNSDKNIFLANVSTGPVFQLPLGVLSFAISGDRLWYGSDNFMFNYALSSSFKYPIDKTSLFEVGLKYQNKNYIKSVDKAKNSDVKTVNAKYTKQFSPKKTLNIFLSHAIEREDGGARIDVSNDSTSTGFKYTQEVYAKINAYGAFTYIFTDYKEKNIVLGEREDKSSVYAIGLDYQHQKDLAFGLAFTHVNTKSTVPVYAYKKETALLTVTKSF